MAQSGKYVDTLYMRDGYSGKSFFKYLFYLFFLSLARPLLGIAASEHYLIQE
jgi:hypothetical protein